MTEQDRAAALAASPLWAEDDAVDHLVGMAWPPRKET